MRRWNGWGDDSVEAHLPAGALEFLREPEYGNPERGSQVGVRVLIRGHPGPPFADPRITAIRIFEDATILPPTPMTLARGTDEKVLTSPDFSDDS